MRAVDHPPAQRLLGPEAPRPEHEFLGAGEACVGVGVVSGVGVCGCLNTKNWSRARCRFIHLSNYLDIPRLRAVVCLRRLRRTDEAREALRAAGPRDYGQARLCQSHLRLGPCAMVVVVVLVVMLTMVCSCVSHRPPSPTVGGHRTPSLPPKHTQTHEPTHLPAKRMSQAKASSSPPPNAPPSRSATVGMGSASRPDMSARRSCTEDETCDGSRHGGSASVSVGGLSTYGGTAAQWCVGPILP